MKNKSYQHSIFELTERFLGQKNIVTFSREFVHFTGDINCALILGQLLYWSDKTTNEEHWIAKTYNELEEELTLTKRQASRAIETLKKMNILETKIKKFAGNPTVHYRIKVKEFEKSFTDYLINSKND